MTTNAVIASGRNPAGVAVDAAGSIYVTNDTHNTVTVTAAPGTAPIPGITNGIDRPAGIAVGRSGTISVVNTGNGSVTSYSAHGVRIAPTIVGLHAPSGIAADALNRLHIIVGSAIQTFTAAGVRTTPTITTGLSGRDLCRQYRQRNRDDV